MSTISFDHILLEPEHKELLSRLVEAARSLPQDMREEFFVIRSVNGDFVQHRGLGGALPLSFMDLDELAAVGLIRLRQPKTTPMFHVTPRGFAYYKWMKHQEGEPVERVMKEFRDYLTSQPFQEKYPKAYDKWAQAESLLWETDSQQQLTTVGHLCREAIQEFATALVDSHSPPGVDPDKAHYIARIRAVLELKAHQLGEKERPFLDALLIYWGTVADLAQRQEHGALKEGEPLVWEDARTLVFQLMVVMFELDRATAGK